MKTLADLYTWLEAAPEGTSLSARAMLELLRQLDGATATVEMAKAPTPDMTLSEVGAMYGKHANTVREWTKKKGLRSYTDANGQIRITRAALEEWQQAQRREAKGEAKEAKGGRRADLGEWRKHLKKVG